MKVVISADELTPDDFTRAGCNQVFATSLRRWDHDYLLALSGRREVAQAEGDERTAAVCYLLHAVLASRAPWNQAPPPAEDDPMFPTYELDEGAINYLGQIVGLIADDEVRARVADFLYQRSTKVRRKRDIAAARVAVGAYLSEAARREALDGTCWPGAEDRVERAFCIAAELQYPALKQDAVAHTERALTAYTPLVLSEGLGKSVRDVEASFPSRYPAVLMRLLLRFGEGDPVRHGALAERLAQEALAARQWELGRTYLEVAARWHGRGGDPAQELAAMERAAESWVEEGEAFADQTDAHDYKFLMAEHRLRCGIQELRTARGRAKENGSVKEEARLAARIQDVRRLHLQYQGRSVGAHITIHESATMDGDLIFSVVKDKTKLEALIVMTAFSLPIRTEIEDKIREEKETDPFFSLFGLVQVDERGHNTARTDSRAGDRDVQARMYQRAMMLHEINAQTHVLPLLWRVGLDHAVSVSDFAMIAYASRFVPEGRELLFARGLHAGMQSDLDLAIHLLIPQVENAVREIVRARIAADEELRVAHVDVLEDPEAPRLQEALCHSVYAAELARVLGEDTVFALRGILIERFGGNLRNRTLHGLIGSGGMQVWLCWYFWWLVLKICCATAVADNQETR